MRVPIAILGVLTGCSASAAPEPIAAHRAIPRPPPPSVGGNLNRDRSLGDSSDAPSVSLTLVASHAALAPGKRLHLAVLLHLPAEAHIYWTNPGESGLATMATFGAPNEFTLGETLYPGPERFVDESGNESFGYRGRAALLAALDVPAQLSGDHYRFEVHASWLACSSLCVKEQGQATLELAVARTEPIEANTDVSSYLALVPTAWAEVPAASQRWDGRASGTARSVTFAAPGGMLKDFFLLAQAPRGAKRPDVVRQEGSLVVRFAADLPRVDGTFPSGVLLAETQAGPRYYSVELEPGE